MIDTAQPYQMPLTVPFGRSSLRITATATDYGNNVATTEAQVHVLPDTDHDALGDDQETLLYLTHPTDPDTDDDGLLDGAEVALHTNPRAADTDGDGRSDFAEVGAGTDPLNPDVTAPTVTSTDPASGATGVPQEQYRQGHLQRAAARELGQGGQHPRDPERSSRGGDCAAPAEWHRSRLRSKRLAARLSTYAVNVSGVRDRAGNPLAAQLAFSYTTGNVIDTTAPTISSANPASGATNVPVNAAVVIVFSEPVDPLTITEATFHVNDSQGVIGGIGALGVDGRTVTLVRTLRCQWVALTPCI